MLDEPFGYQLRAIRQEQNLKQWELATDLGVQQRHVSDWETGRVEPKLPTLRKLAETLGVPVSRLLEEHQA